MPPTGARRQTASGRAVSKPRADGDARAPAHRTVPADGRRNATAAAVHAENASASGPPRGHRGVEPRIVRIASLPSAGPGAGGGALAPADGP